MRAFLVGMLALSWTTSMCQACVEDWYICPNGRGVGRDPLRNCEHFPCNITSNDAIVPAPALDTLAQNTTCTDDPFFQVCPSGDIVLRDYATNCTFRPCPPFCVNETITCPSGDLKRANPLLNCTFDPCPVMCATDTFTCPQTLAVVRRSAALNCNFTPCPPVVACSTEARYCAATRKFQRRRVDIGCDFDPCPTIKQTST
ncbi:hypothetical protein AaE_007757 [Aphanomyces astaci]|uniref:Uncharacterized protein n=1 Tax=Aphanomyces astaci TaxID=112090 RepID=A0A6A5AH30_APHAT|nr:hypothetical protein AaE_007757 [Aphanomyces astaci]